MREIYRTWSVWKCLSHGVLCHISTGFNIHLIVTNSTNLEVPDANKQGEGGEGAGGGGSINGGREYNVNTAYFCLQRRAHSQFIFSSCGEQLGGWKIEQTTELMRCFNSSKIPVSIPLEARLFCLKYFYWSIENLPRCAVEAHRTCSLLQGTHSIIHI